MVNKADMVKNSRKLDKLKEIVKGLESAVVAFSGGVDSALLVKVCHDVLGDNALAVTAVSETYPEFELDEAKKSAEDIGIKHLVIETRELANKEFSKNPPDRCYYCKTELFSQLKGIAKEHGFKNILNGSNVDDDGDFRPGHKAATEFGSRSPLKEAGLTKDDVRSISKQLGLSTWNKPSFACMSSRIPYGQEITAGKLSMILESENYLRDIGFKNFRVRHHNTIARIEVPDEDIVKLLDGDLRGAIVKKFKEVGFNYITIDIEGLRSGSMNEVLNGEYAVSCSKVKPEPGNELTAPKRGSHKNGKLSLTVFTDGASRGNPGKAGIGAAIYDNNSDDGSGLTLLEGIAEFIGEATNNVAEYKAFRRALEKVVTYNPEDVVFKLDSELLVKQVNKEYKVKNAQIIPLYRDVMGLLEKIPKWKVVHIPRAENGVADSLANKGIDSTE